MLFPMTHITMVVTTDIIHSDTLKRALYTAPEWENR